MGDGSASNTWRQSISIEDHQVTFNSDGPAFRVVVIERESPQALMQALADYTGHMSLPPLWSLGYQQCRFSYQPDTRVMEVADLLRQHQIPSDVIWMDIDYMDGYRIFTFNPKEFPNPKRLNDYLHSRDFKAVYMIDPGVKAEPGYLWEMCGRVPVTSPISHAQRCATGGARSTRTSWQRASTVCGTT